AAGAAAGAASSARTTEEVSNKTLARPVSRINFLIFRISCLVGFWFELDGRRTFLLRSNSNGLLNARDENLSVADFASLCSFHDRRDCLLELLICNDQFDFDLWQKVHRVLTPTVNLGVAFLASKTFNFSDGHPLDSDRSKGVLHLLKFEWFD